MFYYVKMYFTNETIFVSSDFVEAREICELTPETIVVDDSGNSYFSNIELTF